MSDDKLGSWSWSIIHSLRVFRHKKKLVTDQPTDQPTDQRTNERTDKPSYRDAWTYLKKGNEYKKHLQILEYLDKHLQQYLDIYRVALQS